MVFGEIVEGHLHRVGIRHVERQRHGLARVGIGQLVQEVGAARDEAHMPAGGQHAFGHGAADPGAGPCDDSGLHAVSSGSSASGAAAP
jgi:hypothetical protein